MTDNSDFFQFQQSFSNRGTVEIHISDSIAYLQEAKKNAISFDAIITDPPYEIGLHGKAWDNTGIAFSPELWLSLFQVLKPGGYIVAFAASRLYHRVAVAAEDAGFKILPMLTWHFPNGLPKPVNVSELFDRQNVPDRKAIGFRAGSGFTSANAKQGAQRRLTKEFPIYERGVSDEAKEWLGFYYGNNALKPAMEPMVFAQKPTSETKMIDNLRKHHTGAINIGGLKEFRGNNEWPDTTFHHTKAKAKEHGSDHPSVKPVSLMRELCIALCPPGGHILDPFAGTGSTAEAAVSAGFNCTVVEQNPDMEKVIRGRIGI